MRLGLHSIFLSLFIAASSLCAQAEMVVSHKTAGLEYPENTYEGFLASLTMPVDAIEIDLHVTKDKQLVLHHDPVLSSYNCFEKTSQQRVVIAQTPVSDLLALKCFNHKIDAAYRLSKFSDVLDAYAESDQSKLLLVEVKVWDELIENNPLHKDLDTEAMHYPHKQVARLVYEQLRLYDLKNNIVFNTFSRELLLELKALQQPDEKFEYGLLYKGEYSPWKLGLIAFFSPLECYDACWAPDYSEVKKWLETNDIEYFIPNFAQLNNILFRWGYKRHIKGKSLAFKVIPWTLNDQSAWEKYRDYHFDGIITDVPSLYLESRHGR